ncbi:MAG: MMPL family transporter [Deltaproteobacteria bacterium]|nr:MMPL family transporter [Deltaproteobacteria bacterium]MBW2362017.1 MMPL family transporter [Deltaproteobacteria bacterium]
MRDRIERAFERWGHFAYRRAGWVLTAVLGLTLALATQLPNLGFDGSTEAFFHEDDPIRVTYDGFRRQFGSDTLILIAVRPSEIFELGFLEKLRAFHEDLEAEVPMLVEVTSLVNARETRGEGDQLIVGDLMEDWPTSDADVADLERRVMANPLYRDQLVSANGALTTVLLETVVYSDTAGEFDLGGFNDAEPGDPDSGTFLTGDDTGTIVTAVYEVMERHRGPDFELYASGAPVMMADLQGEMQQDMVLFTGLALLAITVLLAAAFRRSAAVILPLVCVVASMTITMSVMTLLGIAIKPPTQILPSFLLAVGVGASVHIMAIFYQARARGEDKEHAIAHALGHSGLAVAMTSLTTAAGLLSFTAAELLPIAEFGVMAPAGVMASLLVTLAMLPAMIALYPMREERRLEGDAPKLSQRIMVATGAFATRNARAVVAAWAVLLVVALGFASQVRLSHAPFTWFPKGHPTRDAADVLNDEMNGSLFLEFLIRTDRENGIQDPELLKRLEAIQANVAEIRSADMFVGKTISVSDVVQEIHQALNENDPDYYAVPDDPRLVAQELLLFENSGSDDLEDLVDPQFSTARLTMKFPFLDAVQFGPFFELLGEEVEAQVGDRAEITTTGLGMLAGAAIGAVVKTLVRSYLIAFAIISPLLVLLIGNFRFGLAAIVPNLAPIILTVGVMGAFGLPLDAFTLMIGSIALGLAVDDTIHFMHNFRRYFSQSGDVESAVRQTLTTTGQALLLTTLVLSSGFFVYFFATLVVLHNFGLLTAMTILVALLADVLLAPALMVLLSRPQLDTATTSMETAR